MNDFIALTDCHNITSTFIIEHVLKYHQQNNKVGEKAKIKWAKEKKQTQVARNDKIHKKK